jgi:lysophospholipase L1-like esterase
VISLLFGKGADGQSSYENDVDVDGQLFLKTHAGAYVASGGIPLPGGNPPQGWSESVVFTPTNVQVKVTNEGNLPASVLVDIEFHDSLDQKAGQHFEVRDFAAGQMLPFNAPTPTQPGTYTVKVGIFEPVLGPGWGKLPAWNNSAGTFTISGIPTRSTLRIMPLGDSITEEPCGYRNELYYRLTAAGFSVKYVGSVQDRWCSQLPEKYHEGHGGATIEEISRNIDAWLSAAQPDYVLLMIGTNNIIKWSAKNGAEHGVTHAALLDQILADRPNVQLIVATIPPISSYIAEPVNIDRAQLGRDLNDAIKRNVAERQAAGKAVHLADVYPVLSMPSDFRDGVHPNQVGHSMSRT